MPYDRIANAKDKTVGAKQTVKAIEKGLASEVVLAQDADEHVKAKCIHSALAWM